MLDYIEMLERLHTRGLSFDMKQYLFCMMTALGENKNVAYCMVFDTENFNRNVPSERELEYLSSHDRDADIMLQQQECQHMSDIVAGWLQSKIQKESSNIKNVKFTTEDVANMLSSLLHERSSSLEEASVRDIVALIRELNNQGALDGDSAAFSKHFVNVFPKMTALCPVCQRETDVAVGLTCYCSRCGAKFTWNEDEKRYYPEPTKL